MDSTTKAIFDQLLYQYDWQIRCVAKVQAKKQNDEYVCGYADATAQAILDIGRISGEPSLSGPYKTEAYKRVCEFTSAAQYVIDYPEPVPQPKRGA